MCSTARLCSNVGYAFVHMEKKEEALAAIDALNGTMYKGRQLAVELSKAQPLINQLVTGNSTGVVAGGDEGSICFLFRVCIQLNAEIHSCPCTYPLPFSCRWSSSKTTPLTRASPESSSCPSSSGSSCSWASYSGEFFWRLFTV